MEYWFNATSINLMTGSMKPSNDKGDDRDDDRGDGRDHSE